MSSWAAIHPERCGCRKQRGIFDAGKLRKTCSKSSRPLRAANGRRAIPTLRTVGWYARSWAGKANRASVSPPETIVRRRNYSNIQTPESFGFFLYAQQNPPFFKTGFIVSTGVNKVPKEHAGDTNERKVGGVSKCMLGFTQYYTIKWFNREIFPALNINRSIRIR